MGDSSGSMADTEPAVPSGGAADSLDGYRVSRPLGAGGMGEVVAAVDRAIGREVAIKRLKGDDPGEAALARFLREATLQARLEHPAIVPVYAIARDERGQPYFTMKRLAGVTLYELLASGTATLQRLLRAFVDVVQAIEYAHARRVVHRDLKPANIMLGDFGEVYVLDWGLARELDAPSPALPGAGTSAPGLTAAGAILGTPGYMAPEQLEDAATSGPPADVYALGAILFELLAGEPLHARDRAIASTVERCSEAPRARAPARDIAPELDALCVRALGADPAQRPTARELAAGVQQYLDGDRDLALRRAMADAALGDARAHLAAGARGDAIRSAGRALALDPGSADAAAVIAQLMLEAPPIPPPELRDELRAAEEARVTTNARTRVVTWLLSAALVVATAPVIHSWPLFVALLGTTLTLAAMAWSLARRPRDRERTTWVFVVVTATCIMLCTRIASPFVLAPAMACVAVGTLVTLAIGERYRSMAAIVIAGWAVPCALELAGVLPPTWELANGELALRSELVVWGGPSLVVLLVATGILIVLAGAHGIRLTRLNLAYERELQSQRWHYRQLLPR